MKINVKENQLLKAPQKDRLVMWDQPNNDYEATFGALFPATDGRWQYKWFQKCRETLCYSYGLVLHGKFEVDAQNAFLLSNDPRKEFSEFCRIINKNGTHSKLLVGIQYTIHSDQIATVLELLNEFEEWVGLSGQKTFITKTDAPNKYLAVFNVPNEWVKATPLISLYCLIIRTAVAYLKFINHKKAFNGSFMDWIQAGIPFPSALNDFSTLRDHGIAKMKLLKENGPDYEKLNSREIPGGRTKIHFGSWGISACPATYFEKTATKKEEPITQKVN